MQSSQALDRFRKLLSQVIPILFAIVIVGHPSLIAQQETRPEQTNPDVDVMEWRMVIPGEEYAAGTLHRLFFGDLWRAHWTIPIRVPVIDLSAFAGGLRAYRKGGGFQTRSLRFKAADGLEYKFRSLNKDPSKILEENLRNTFVSDIMQDLISTANPFGALVASPILESTGTLNAAPTVVILPDSPELGEFRASFAGLLGMLEVHPDEREDSDDGFGGSDKVVGTFTMFEKLEKDTDERVDAREYLKARIVDMFMGDWDRHTDQWRWARFEKDGIRWWHPIPRDRDQAFCRYDGLIPWLSTVVVPQIESCDNDYPGIKYLTYSGRHLDRRYLPALSRGAYDSLALHVQSVLTDDLLADAVNRLPAELHGEESDHLLSTLLNRRDKLPEAVRVFYEELAREVNIHGSKEDELVEIMRRPDGSVAVAGRSMEDPELPPFHERVYLADETNEIRIYLEGGDDVAILRGESDYGPTIRVLGGSGRDRLIDSSVVHGCLWGLLPFIPSAETKTYFYDHGKRTAITSGASTAVDRNEYPSPETPQQIYEPDLRDWGWDLLPGISGAYNGDLGILLGGGPVYTRYGFKCDPYAYRMSLTGGFAPTSLLGEVEFNLDTRALLRRHSVTLTAGFSDFKVLHYFGAGNHSVKLEDPGYEYTVKQSQIYLNSALHLFLSETVTLSTDISLRHVRNDTDDEALYLMTIQPYGYDPMILGSVGLDLTIDQRSSATWPTSGYYLSLGARHYPELFDLISRFETFDADLRTYLSATLLTDWTLALRAGGQYNRGNYPFFESAFLGGIESARGYDLNRYAGDAAVYGGAEWRGFLANVRWIIPSELGILAFAESGRVYLEDEGSDQWHATYGAGLWLAPVSRDFTISASLGNSRDGMRVDVSAGFAF